jgi:hypothetical protein
MWPIPSCFRARPTFSQLDVRDLAASRRGDEVVAAAIGVELHEQAVALDHLDETVEAAHGAFLADQKAE